MATLSQLLGPVGTWFGAGVLMSAYGFLSKHLYLSGFGVDYAQFAKTDDLLLNATEAFAFIVPATAASIFLGWAFVTLRRNWPKLLSWLGTASKYMAFAAILAGWTTLHWLAKAVAGFVNLFSNGATDGSHDSLSNSQELLNKHKPTPPVATAAGSSPQEISATAVFTAVLCLVMAMDLFGRYGASRPDILSKVSDCAFSSPRACVGDLVMEAVEFAGSKSRSWGLSPTPRRVRLVGAKDDLPQILRASWTNSDTGPDLWLVDRNSSFAFLQACASKACAEGDRKNQAVVVSADTFSGLSFSEAVSGGGDTPPTAPAKTIVELDPGKAAEVLGVAFEKAEHLLGTANVGTKDLVAAFSSLEKAVKSIPRTIEAKETVTVPQSVPVELRFDRDSLAAAHDHLADIAYYSLRSRQTLDVDIRTAEDCLEKRKLARNLLQNAAGREVSDVASCFKTTPLEKPEQKLKEQKPLSASNVNK